MDIYKNQSVVLTLDAGGTNFVFSAIKAGKELFSPIVLPSNAHDLDLCLKTIIDGFEKLKKAAQPDVPVAISFAFPGPADYKNGIISDLMNLPCFKGGVALGPMLEAHFGIPTYINNDGDLFAYGEAIGGMLPRLNSDLKLKGADKQYSNLVGITLGTGLGCGIIQNQKIMGGDNSAGGEIWLVRNFKHADILVEESVSIRAVQRVYAQESGDSEFRTPEDIYYIAIGQKEGHKKAALAAFSELSTMFGEALANALTLLDAPVVIGGGLSGASDLILPAVLRHLNGTIENLNQEKMPRLVSKVYNMEDPDSYAQFLDWKTQQIPVPFTDQSVSYSAEKKLIVGLSKMGTSKAVSLGAYAHALSELREAGY
ncbi:ROK family protein [Chryseobacterium sp. A301]